MLRIFKTIALTIIILIDFVFIAAAQENINISFDKDSAYVGDIINLKITAELPLNAQISANQNISFNNFDVLGSDIKHISISPNIYEIDVKIAAYNIGDLQIEPIVIYYINPDGTNNLFFTPQTKFEIQSLIGAGGHNENIKDIKPLLRIPIKTGWLILIIILIAGILTASLFLYKEIDKKRIEKQIIELDIKTLSLNALSALYESALKDTTPSLFYYKMSEIFRNYISKQYNFDAMEMTTTELLESLRKVLPQSVNINDFKSYLQIFVLAQYAAFKPSAEEISHSFNFTKELLEKL
jgi:hypothetical protein